MAKKSNSSARKTNTHQNLTTQQKIALRFVALPGYSMLFTAWVVALGMLSLGLYYLLPEQGEGMFVNHQPRSDLSQASVSNADVVALVIAAGLFWCIASWASAQALRWLMKRCDFPADRFWDLQVMLLIGGWLITVGGFTVVAPDLLDAMLVFAGVAIMIGAFSFGAESTLLKYWGGRQSDSW